MKERKEEREKGRREQAQKEKKKGIVNTYRTKCWKMYFKIEKLIGGSLFSKPRSANKRQLRSVFTSIFRFDGAPFRDRIDAETDPIKLAELYVLFGSPICNVFNQLLVLAHLRFLPAPS